jgi:hypothetical protein
MRALVSCSHSYMIPVPTRVAAVQGRRLLCLTSYLRGNVDTAAIQPLLCPV